MEVSGGGLWHELTQAAARLSWRSVRFETSWPTAHIGLVWAAVLVAVAMPFPAFGWPLPERAVPIMWLLLGGAAVVAAIVARVSWPLALLFCWAIWRAKIMQFPMRALQLLLLVAMVGLMYAVARDLPRRSALIVAWAIVVGMVYEGVFGYLNLWRIYPWMQYIQPDQAGRSMGFLTHPNYWGSFMALGLPVLWSLLGFLPALAVLAMIAGSYSGGPVISALVGSLVLVWPELGKKMRYAVIVGATAVTSVVMTVHEWRLSGRREVWAAIWPELMRYPFIGQGLGSWRVWADHYNFKLAQKSGHPEVFATLQAHNEPYQLWFELGLIGLALAVLWVWQASRASWQAYTLHNEPIYRQSWWMPGRIPLERAWVAVLVTACVNSLGSPTFHLPGQAALAVFALAQVQALAAVAPPSSARLWRMEAPQMNESLTRAARRQRTRAQKVA